MKLKVLNIDGEYTDNIEISDKIFSVKPSKSIVKSILDWQLNKFKPRTAKTKQRSEAAKIEGAILTILMLKNLNNLVLYLN